MKKNSNIYKCITNILIKYETWDWSEKLQLEGKKMTAARVKSKWKTSCLNCSN